MIQSRKQNYSIRKYAIGTSSVLLGVTIFMSLGSSASAEEIQNETSTTTDRPETTVIQSNESTETDIKAPVEKEAPSNTEEATTEVTEEETNTNDTSSQSEEMPQASNSTLDTETNETKTSNETSESQQNEEPVQEQNTQTRLPESTPQQHDTSENNTSLKTNVPSSTEVQSEKDTSLPIKENTTDAQTLPSQQNNNEAPDAQAPSPKVESSNTPDPALTKQSVFRSASNNDVNTTDNQPTTEKVNRLAPAPSEINAPELENVETDTNTPEDAPPPSETNQSTAVATATRSVQDSPSTAQALSDKAETTQSQPDYDVLKSDEMEATIDKTFPAVKSYQLKNGKTIDGQVVDNRNIILNGTSITPQVSYEKVNDSTARYTLDAKDEENQIDATLKFELSIQDRNVDLKMTDLINHNTDPEQIINIFGFEDQSLVSVNSSQDKANLTTTKMSTDTTKSGDESYDIDADFDPEFSDMGMYGFVSNADFSAGLWSNAQIGTGGSQDYLRVLAKSHQVDDKINVGLGSTAWIIQPTPEHESAMDQDLLPHIKIAIAEDENDDGNINWQDGAIRYRDIMNNPYGSEEVPELVGYRIAMNFGSQAQNPFLKTLDGVKKFYLNTDGLGQSIILKGYGSEGHDSGHLDYANIGERMGGAEDFNNLLEKGADYGARFGIHVNASETYPESKVFNPDLLRKNEDGTFNYGWNWLDQGININADYDLTHGRKERFEALKEIVGDRLDFIYVDVWGNGQSGDNSAWPSHQLAKELNDLGWRVGVEWGHGMEYDSTFQHWAADLTYGNAQNKGINSEVARFIRNHQKDSWVGNYPSYSGAADFPLLGGYDMKDFEGWQGRNNYKDYITNIFKTDVPTKFLQHYLVNRIEHGDPVKMKANDQTIDWTPEMLVELTNDAGDIVTVERKSNDYENDIDNYRSRTIRLNDRLILDGDTYLIPWNWDADGQPLTGDQEKLYHWNSEGGSTTWTLPDTWKTNEVALYKLTETGRELVDTVAVNNGEITLNDIDADTPYVIYQTEQPEEEIQWSEDMHVEDAGFNSQQLDHWQAEGDTDQVSIVKSVSSNDMLKFSDVKEDTQLTQTLTDLEPGKQYALYVGVDNRSDALARAIVSNNGETIASNQTGQSIAKNYVQADAHNSRDNSATFKDGSSYFQNMYVFFTAPEDGEVTLSLARDAGEGDTYFDDIRVVDNDSNLLKDGTYYQDFENVPQGLFPFVVSEVEGVQDNRIHLSEYNAPYTQRGWNGKRVDDVIDGKWSLKVNGQTGKDKMVIHTIPQNFYFEPGKTYTVSFDYEAGSDDTYAFAVGNGDISKNRDFTITPLKNTIDPGAPQRVSFDVTGDENGLTWVGIYSTDAKNDPRGVEDSAQIDFEGTKDFILDNLTITRVEDKEDTTPDTPTDTPQIPGEEDNTTPDVSTGDNNSTTNPETDPDPTQPDLGEDEQLNTEDTVNDDSHITAEAPNHQDQPGMANHTTGIANEQKNTAQSTQIDQANDVTVSPTYLETSMNQHNNDVSNLSTSENSNNAQIIDPVTGEIITTQDNQTNTDNTSQAEQLPETGQTHNTSRTGFAALIAGLFATLFAYKKRRRNQ
ncbi:endo-alpha-N-acetylgalactosaminidase family protein [Staphylococcus sp. 11261D007BR]